MEKIYYYYYTPLPLNLANNNNKQNQATTSNKHFSFPFANTPSQPSQRAQNSTVAPQVGGGNWAGALPKLRILCPKTAFFGPKQPWNIFKTAKRRETLATLHVPLQSPVSKSLLKPSECMICP